MACHQHVQKHENVSLSFQYPTCLDKSIFGSLRFFLSKNPLFDHFISPYFPIDNCQNSMDALAPFAQVRNWEEDWSVTPEAGKTESKSSKSEG
jgi:hypothetical protein